MSSGKLLLTATANLKKGIEYAVNQIRSKKVNPGTKLRWMRSLTPTSRTPTSEPTHSSTSKKILLTELNEN